MEKLRVGVEDAGAALVDVDERRLAAASFGDVAIDRVIRKVGLCAGKPAERWRARLEDAIPGPEPRQLARGLVPERFRILSCVFDPAPDDRRNEFHAVHGDAPSRSGEPDE